MEVLLLIISVVIIIMLIVQLSGIKSYLYSLDRRYEQIRRQNEELVKELQHLRKEGGTSSTPSWKTTQQTQPAPQREVPQPKPIQPPLPVQPKPDPIIRSDEKEEQTFSIKQEKLSYWQQFLRNNPDLEKFIGENLVNKVGIAILVLGISFFVKYAIDQNWIPEAGRVIIGIFCGLILNALAHYMRNSYRSFSSVIAGGGIAVYYFSIAFAFHQYHLISQTAAFLLMVAVTAFAIFLAVLYNRIELGIIAAIGGFLTPFMVSTGTGNYIVLFTYLAILNSGLLALAFFKRWPLINIIAMVFTQLIYGGWIASNWFMEATDYHPAVGLLFGGIYFFLFLGMNLVHQVRFKQEFKKFDFFILIFINATFFIEGAYLLNEFKEGIFLGLFAIALGLVNFILARTFFRNSFASRLMVNLLIAQAICFLTIAIPLQLKGHAITLLLSAEFVLLFWLYLRSRIRLFAIASVLTVVFAMISLFIDWSYVLNSDSSKLVLIFNSLQGFITNLVVVAALVFLSILVGKEKENLILNFSTRIVQKLAWVTAFSLFYITAVYGINYLFRHHSGYETANVYHRLITLFYAFALAGYIRKTGNLKYARMVIGAATIYLLFHLFSFNLADSLRKGVKDGSIPLIHLFVHWLNVFGACILLSLAIRMNKKSGVIYFSSARITWVTSILLVFFFSHEARHLFMLIGNGISELQLEQQFNKAVLTIVWALASFGFMWTGMKSRNRNLRIVSLSLFTLALLKLFIADLRGISEGGKIAAFILLGVLLLTISFMYQKLKKMIIDDVRE